MESSLKAERFYVKALDREVTLRQPSAATQIALLEKLREIRARDGGEEPFSAADNIRFAAITCAGCVVDWEGETPDSLLNSHSADVLLEITAEVEARRSRPKNSEGAPSDDSSSG